MHLLGSLVLAAVIICSQAFSAPRDVNNIHARGLEKRNWGNTLCSTEPSLYNYGGGILSGNINFYTVYYGPFSSWPGAMTGTQNFLSALGNSSYWAQLQEYGITGKWSNSGHSFHDTSRTSGTITQANIESWLPTYVHRGNLPADKNAHMVFIISKSFTVNMTNGQLSCVDFCSLHGSYVDKTNFGTSSVSITYTLLPECTISGCQMNLGYTNNYLNWWTALLTHEFSEAATDPWVTLDVIGWYSVAGSCSAGGEIADICNAEGQMVALSGSTQYGVQLLWVQTQSTCRVA